MEMVLVEKEKEMSRRRRQRMESGRTAETHMRIKAKAGRSSRGVRELSIDSRTVVAVAREQGFACKVGVRALQKFFILMKEKWTTSSWVGKGRPKDR
jgi:hypothetical protein